MKQTFLLLSISLHLNFINSIPVKSQTIFNYELNGEIKGISDKSKIVILKIHNNRRIYDTIGIGFSTGTKYSVSIPRSHFGDINMILVETKAIKSEKKNKFGVAYIVDQNNITLNSALDSGSVIEFPNSNTNSVYYQIINEIKQYNKEFQAKQEKSADEKKLNSEEYDKEYLRGIKLILKKRPNELSVPVIFDAFASLFHSYEALELFDPLPLIVKQSPWGQLMKQNIETMKLNETLTAGTKIPQFWLKTINGDSINIYQVASKYKYTLIDFWASWCSPCRAEAPNLKQALNKFQSLGFNIIGISTDTKIDKWKKAIEEDKTPWLHCIEDENEIHKNIFSIKSIPAYILIDQTGTLLSFDCAVSRINPFGPKLRGSDLFRTLDSLLKNANQDSRL